ncbi:acyltransferase [Pseudomonadales bacterium]|nr:acyltransferase [Pseudomonadales bacterium]
MKKILKSILDDPLKPISRLISFIYGILTFSLSSRVQHEANLKLNGIPIIDIQQGTALFIGKNVLLNSRNRGYHVNMHSPVKLFADIPGARIKIGDNTRIHGSCIHAHLSIEIGARCLIAANCQIIDGSGHNASFAHPENRINSKGSYKPICIEDDVWLGTAVIVLPGVTIGKGSIVGAGSVVDQNIPPFSIAKGNPVSILPVKQ